MEAGMKAVKHRFPIYSQLTRLYPTPYRNEYGEQMLQTLADMLDDPDRARFSVWARTIVDFPFSVVKQQIIYTGEILATETPSYITRTALSGSGLVAPFFILLSLNGMLHNRLQHSWVWNTTVLFIWLILLPTLAALLALISFIRWAGESHRTTKQNIWKLLLSFRKNWPILSLFAVSIAILALVFFHDSVHCIAGNPIREIHNPRDTLRCIQRG